MTRRLRSLVAVSAAAALAVGGSIAFSAPAHAAPGDPAIFTDHKLADAVNLQLGQNPGDTITEAQAASITDLAARNAGITNLTGIGYLTGLKGIDLDDNQITNLSPLASLTGLTELSLYNNGITDASALSGMTTLQYLYLDYNNITDLSPFPGMTGLVDLSLTGNGITHLSQLSGMTGLNGLYLDENKIADLSPLSGFTELKGLILYDNEIADLSPLSSLTGLEGLALSGNRISDVSPLSSLTGLEGLQLERNRIRDLSPLSSLTGLRALSLAENSIADISPLSSLTGLVYVTLDDQNVTLPGVGVGVPTMNPVATVNGDPVVVTSTEPDFSYDVVTDTWAFAGTGAKALAWTSSASVGEASDVIFSGTLTQNVSKVTPLVTPQDPVVVQSLCVDGAPTRPQITLPTTEGIVYSIVGDVDAGATVTIMAEAEEGRIIVVTPDSRWTTDSDGVVGALTISLDKVDCGARPDTDENKTLNSKTNKDELAKTGLDQPVTIFGALAALMALAGIALIAVRRRSATR